MLGSRLHFKFLATMMLIIVALTVAVYSVSVPWIEKQTYNIELEASQTILDNIYEMSAKVMGGLKEQRTLTVDSFKQNLRTVVRLAATYIETALRKSDAGEIPEDVARRLAFDGLRDFRYGANDYVWVTDYRSVMQSHPDPARHGRDASEVRDERSGFSIIPTIVEIARREGEGFHEYAWARLGSIQPAQKISYFVDMPHRGLVIGSGAYLDDIEAEVEKRKEEAVEQLRAALREIRIAKTGYAFIFDASNKMLIHPNANIEGAYIDNRIDPASGKPIGDVLREAADTQQPVTYLWDKPSDPGNYTYQKISSVRHFKELNWYIASSVYVDELTSGARRLRNRILIVSLFVIGLGVILAYAAAARLAAPLQRLAEAARQVQAGNLDVDTRMARRDEIGVLASAFHEMMVKVRGHTDNLESLVRARTQELETANRELKTVNASLQRSKEALADAELKQRHILDGIPAAIAYLDGEEHVRFLNKTAESLLGVRSADVLGARLSDAAPPWAVSALGMHLRDVKAGANVVFDHTHHDDNGRRTMLKTTLIPHMGACGEVVGFFVLSYDTTDEREAEQRLRMAERLMAVGQLSGGLAHDFNNLLSIILGNLARAADVFGDMPELMGYLEAAQRAGRRGADITNRLLAFSRKQQLRETKVDIGQAMHDVGSLVERSLPPSVRFSIDAEPDQLWTTTDVAQLETMLVNLAFNARDAMPDGGTLVFSVAERSVTSAIAFDQLVVPGVYVEIAVRDTGEGFSAGTLDRAFDPFFTTKRNGCGLGLSMVYGFVKQSKGYIKIESQEGAGTCVTVLLPRADPPDVETVPATVDAGRHDWVRPTALVCEDDGGVRRVMVEQLVGLGFSVVEAENGDEAVRMLERLDAIDLVVTDVVMPGASGIEVVSCASRQHPTAAFVYCTAYSADSEKLHDQVVLRKPWEASDLTRAIQVAMTRAPSVAYQLGG